MEVFTLKSTLKTLEDQVQALCLSLEGQPMICASKPGPFATKDEAYNLASGIFSNFWVGDEAIDARETPVVIGAIEAAPHSLELAEQVNWTKDKLKSLLMQLRETKAQGLSRAGQDKAFRRYLSDIGLGRLSLRQVYRHIPALKKRPKTVSFSLSRKGKSITRLNTLQALDMIDKSGMSGPHIDIQVKTLMSLPDDFPLAQIQHLAAYYKANIRYMDAGRETIPVFMPLLYPEGDGLVSLPLDLYESRRTPRPRKDQSVDPTPLIPSLRIHTYL